jgi:hypothetical protein
MALNHFGARHFRANTFKTFSHFSVEVVLRDKTGGTRKKWVEFEAERYNEEMHLLYEQARRDEEEIIAVIVTAMEIIQ